MKHSLLCFKMVCVWLASVNEWLRQEESNCFRTECSCYLCHIISKTDAKNVFPPPYCKLEQTRNMLSKDTSMQTCQLLYWQLLYGHRQQWEESFYFAIRKVPFSISTILLSPNQKTGVAETPWRIQPVYVDRTKRVCPLPEPQSLQYPASTIWVQTSCQVQKTMLWLELPGRCIWGVGWSLDVTTTAISWEEGEQSSRDSPTAGVVVSSIRELKYSLWNLFLLFFKKCLL